MAAGPRLRGNAAGSLWLSVTYLIIIVAHSSNQRIGVTMIMSQWLFNKPKAGGNEKWLISRRQLSGEA